MEYITQFINNSFEFSLDQSHWSRNPVLIPKYSDWSRRIPTQIVKDPGWEPFLHNPPHPKDPCLNLTVGSLDSGVYKSDKTNSRTRFRTNSEARFSESTFDWCKYIVCKMALWISWKPVLEVKYFVGSFFDYQNKMA